MNGTTTLPNSDHLKDAIPLLRSPSLALVLNTPKGRGVFASEDIPARTVVEVSPVLVLDPAENEQHVRKTDLYNYTYNWPYSKTETSTSPPTPPSSTDGNNSSSTTEASHPPPKTTQAIILGLGSMFNHSSLHQNIGWTRNLRNLTITYATLRDVKRGEELCISYGDRLTFVDADAEERRKIEESEDEAEAGLGSLEVDAFMN